MNISNIETETLEYVLNSITSDEKKDSLLDVLYSDDATISKSALLEYIKSCLIHVQDIKIKEFVDQLEECQDAYTYFLIVLKEKLVSQISNDLGEECDPIFIATIEQFTFWSMYAVAIKKCIGVEHAGDIVSPSSYFATVYDRLNQYQKQAHNECLKYFNLDVKRFTLKNTQDLKLFLHKFHSRNKTVKTRKKNLRRVERRAKKIMQVNKLAHVGKSKVMFSHGKYRVPGQFADAIVMLYFKR